MKHYFGQSHNDLSRGHPKWWFSKGHPHSNGRNIQVKDFFWIAQITGSPLSFQCQADGKKKHGQVRDFIAGVISNMYRSIRCLFSKLKNQRNTPGIPGKHEETLSP